MNNISWYRIRNVIELDSPSLVVFPERIKTNIQAAIGMIDNNRRLRPHVKTHKCADVVQLMMHAGINKFKCATIAEAEMLGICGAQDVLLAYQATGPKLLRLIQLIKKYPATNYSCLTDNRQTAAEQAEAFSSNGLDIPVYIDLNVGMNRTGIAPGAEAIELYLYCNDLKGITPRGLHAYDGHIRNPDFNKRKNECNRDFTPVVTMKAELENMGIAEPVIIAGGSHTFPIHSKRKSIECSPGTFVYWDKSNSDYCPEQPFIPAAVLVTRIVSLPDPTKVCVDMGHKSVAAENEITKRVFFLNAPELRAVSQSEEHLVLEARKKHSYSVGDVLYGLPFHICPTVALYESVKIIEDGQVSGEWKNMARDRKITI